MNTENVVIAENLYKRFIAKPSKKTINALTNINIKISAENGQSASEGHVKS